VTVIVIVIVIAICERVLANTRIANENQFKQIIAITYISEHQSHDILDYNWLIDCDCDCDVGELCCYCCCDKSY
jgi:hypothetical protein